MEWKDMSNKIDVSGYKCFVRVKIIDSIPYNVIRVTKKDTFSSTRGKI